MPPLTYRGAVMAIVGAFDMMCNTAEDVRARNAEINLARGFERFGTKPPHDGKVCIVGGGPSLADCLDEIKARQMNGWQVWATNNTYRFLQSHDIQPDVHVLLDARAANSAFLNPDPRVQYFVHVSCDPALLDMLDGCRVCLYDLNGESTGTTVGLKALYLAGFSGFAEFYLYGFDSSYRDDKHHAYDQPLNEAENVIEVHVEGKAFRCAPWMAIQAEEFQSIAVSFAQQDKVIHVAGDGLLPFVARRLVYAPKVLTAVWDFHLCPTSYDFVVFVGEAEKHRIAIGAEFIDFVFQPGPVDGFRYDDLPPNLGNREGMYYRVLVGLCRLLPSTRNIQMFRNRTEVKGDHFFPEDYQVNQPTCRYGQYFAQFATPVLRSTVAASLFVERRYTKPYVTITLREASHWPSRNSNRGAWERVAQWLEERGYQVVWVPDAESPDANLFSYDVDMRLALYERAVVNLGINNGPTNMLPYTNAKWLMFKLVTEDVPWTTRAFHEKWGNKEGDQPGGRGRMIFETDDYEIIIPELERFFAKQSSIAA